MNFSGMLNSKNSWLGHDDYMKFLRVDMLSRGFFRPGKFLTRGKYMTYGRTQPDLMWSANQCLHGARRWNYGRTRQNKHFLLFPWRK